MKVLYLELRNFATIMSGMKRRIIKIDLTKSKNRVVLFVGDNGTGKTALLSTIHPFATPGNMDVRNGGDLIIEGEDGYKEIHIQHGDTVYVIKHHYLNKTGKGMKSYIAKNRTEMNPNGNVTSFKEIVETELGINQDYLKLLRLGSNVTNFIRMKATDRKNFTSDLLSDIDIYSKFYKKINDDSRLLKNLMKSVTDKIDKLKIFDESEEIRRMEDLEQQLKDAKEIRDTITGELGKIEGSINILVPDGLDMFIVDIKTKKSEYKRIMQDIESKNKKLHKFNLVFFGDIDSTIKHYEKEVADHQNQLIVNKNMLEFYFNQLNSLHDQKKEKEDGMKYIASELELSRLNELYLQLNRDKERLGKKFKDFQPKCTRDDMLHALATLQEMDKFKEDIYEFDERAIISVIDHHLKGHNIDGIVRNEVTKIDDKVSRLNRTLSAQAQSANVNPNAVYVMYTPPGCECACPYKQFYEDVTGAKTDAQKDDIQTELKKLESKRDYFMQFPDISKKVDYILLLIKTNKALIEKLPDDFFNIKTILECIKGFIPFYDEEYITNYISFLEDYDVYVDLDKKIKDVLKEKTFIEKSSGSITSVQKDLERIDKEIFTFNSGIEQLRFDNQILDRSIENKTELLEGYREWKEIMESVKELLTESSRLEYDLTKMEQTEVRVNQLVESRRTQLGRQVQIDREIQRVETDINSIRFRLLEFKNLNEEKKELEDKFDDIDVIKEALSSNKGIPLLFIQLYLRNTRMMVNQLLDTVYNGDLEVQEFIINDKEFRIPYVRNGLLIDDVAKCSQGEESFVSMALSFALNTQSVKEYNIMLLDEIDATLSTKKREQFLNILDTQLDSIDAEQVFLITHNNMFDSYPVDIIMTSDMPIDNYKNTNIIFKA